MRLNTWSSKMQWKMVKSIPCERQKRNVFLLKVVCFCCLYLGRSRKLSMRTLTLHAIFHPKEKKKICVVEGRPFICFFMPMRQ